MKKTLAEQLGLSIAKKKSKETLFSKIQTFEECVDLFFIIDKNTDFDKLSEHDQDMIACFWSATNFASQNEFFKFMVSQIDFDQADFTEIDLKNKINETVLSSTRDSFIKAMQQRNNKAA